MTALAFRVDRIPRELARTEEIYNQDPAPFLPLRAAAQRLTRRGLAAAKCELINSALLAFTELVYEYDSDGVAPNVDRDGRLRVPAPWARSGGRLWGLRATEQRAFNVIMRRRSAGQGEPLFVYDDDLNGWLLNLTYSIRRQALAYLRHSPIELGEWRDAWAATRSAWARLNLGDD